MQKSSENLAIVQILPAKDVGKSDAAYGKERKGLKGLKKFIEKHGEKICAMEVAFGGISLMSCRFIAYEPEQPEGLDKLVSRCNKK